jgi:dihydrofolate reductase
MALRNLIEVTFMSLDGVIDAPNIVEEAKPYWFSDEEHSKMQEKFLSSADALLLGRKTYEVFADAYPKMKSTGFVDRMNSIPKYVASRTVKKAKWNASIIDGDIASEVSKLKQGAGKDILKYGTGALDQALLTNNLIDFFHILVHPFFIGRGKRLLEGSEIIKHLKLIDTTTFKNGTVVLTYRCGT